MTPARRRPVGRPPLVIIADTVVLLVVLGLVAVVHVVVAVLALLDGRSWWWLPGAIANVLLAWWAFDFALEHRAMRREILDVLEEHAAGGAR